MGDRDCCRHCRFWKSYGEIGNCHRRAPINASSHSSWPMTSNYEWCGEFEPVSAPQPNVDEGDGK
jgi:hypothetical protein